MMFLWLPFLFLIPFAIIWMARSGSGAGCCGMGHTGPAAPPGPGSVDLMDIARRRLARGEIDSAQFDEIRRALG